METLCFRPMEQADLPQVTQIEKTTFSHPWTEGLFRQGLHAANCWVFEQEGVVQAYGVISVQETEAHLLNLCVRPESRRRGLGRRILARLLNQARSGGALVVVLEVRPSNHPAIALYQSMGFRELSTRQDYYPAAGGREDALILAVWL